MARPITWQDVAAPRGGAVAVEALLRSGRQAGEGLERIGQTFMDANRAQKEAATGAAVAAIANSNDPLAQAAATPQGWQFDPLAIATASNAREGQLFDRTVKESDLRENELSIQNTQSLLDDRESMRTVATLIAPYEALARAGKDFDVDEDSHPAWKTPAGMAAKKHLEELRNSTISQNLERERNALQARQARAAEDALKMSKAERQTRDLFVNYMQTKGAGSSLAEQQRMGRLFGEQTGAGVAFGATMPDLYGNNRGVATTEEKDTYTRDGITYTDAVSGLTQSNLELENEKAVALKDLELAVAGARAIINPNYKGLTGEAVNLAVLKNNPDMASGKGWFRLSKDSEDVQEARDDQMKLARTDAVSIAQTRNLPAPGKDFVPLLPEQEAALAELVLAGNNDAAASLRQQFVAYNLVGGEPGLAVITQQRTGGFDVTIARNNEEIRRAEAAAMFGQPLSQAAIEAYKRTPKGQIWDKQLRSKEWDFIERSLQNSRNQR